MNLSDLYHYFGSDLSASNSGDVQVVDATVRGQQRILRRLLTNPGDYIFQPEYGAGLPRWVGRTAQVQEIRALIRGQILQEAAVAKVPEPVIKVGEIPNQAGGGFAVSIAYSDAATGQPATLSFNVTG